MKTDILYLNKSPYENGKMSGNYFKDKINIDLKYINNVLLNNNKKDLIVHQFNKLKKNILNTMKKLLEKQTVWELID